MGAVAGHIRDALTDPESTRPTKAGKNIPGGDASSLLHRIKNSDPQYSKNRNATKKACRTIKPSDTTNLQCDEFPFASTAEGSGKGDGNYSLRYLAEDHNEAAGRALGIWYSSDRILAGDGFYVEIVK